MISWKLLPRNCLNGNVFKIQRNIHLVSCHYNESNLVKDSDAENEVLDPEEIRMELEYEENLLQRRNKSGLEPQHYNRLHKIATPLSPVERDVTTLSKLRAQFGEFGVASGVDYKYLWPSRQERELSREWEQVAFPSSLPEMMSKAKQDRSDSIAFTAQRQKQIRDNMKSLNMWKQEVQGKVEKKENEARKAREKREKLIEEVRLMFGVRMDPNDDKFQAALEKKEIEERKTEKALKKQQKQQRMLDQMRKLAEAARIEVAQKDAESESLQNKDIREPIVVKE